MTKLIANGAVLMENPEIVLFDKDGTLIDIHHYWYNMIERRANSIVEKYFCGSLDSQRISSSLIDAMGGIVLTHQIKYDGPVGVKPRPYIVNVVAQAMLEFDVQVESAAIEAIFAEVDLLTSNNLLPLLKLLPGVLDLLEGLRSNEIDAAIVTNDITSRAIVAVQVLGIEKYFRCIVGGNSARHTKPSPDLVMAALTHCKRDQASAVVIGDHPVDIRMGQQARCAANVGVLSGLARQSDFEKLNCTIVPDLCSLTVRGN